MLAIKDTTGGGKANVIQRFGPDNAAGAAGGSGIAIYDGAIYAELNDKIVRYKLAPGEIAPTAAPETVLSGMPLTGDHPMHPFVIDAKGNLADFPFYNAKQPGDGEFRIVGHAEDVGFAFVPSTPAVPMTWLRNGRPSGR